MLKKIIFWHNPSQHASCPEGYDEIIFLPRSEEILLSHDRDQIIKSTEEQIKTILLQMGRKIAYQIGWDYSIGVVEVLSDNR